MFVLVELNMDRKVFLNVLWPSMDFSGEQIQMAFSLVNANAINVHVQDPPSRAPTVTCLATSEPRSSLCQDIQPEFVKLIT